MRTHAAILKTAGFNKIAEACPDPSVHTIRSWFYRENIPAEYWKALANAGIASLDDLAEAAAHAAAQRRVA